MATWTGLEFTLVVGSIYRIELLFNFVYMVNANIGVENIFINWYPINCHHNSLISSFY